MEQVHVCGTSEYYELRDDLQRRLQRAGLMVDALYAAGEHQDAEDLDAVLETAIEETCTGMAEFEDESFDYDENAEDLVPEHAGARLGCFTSYWDFRVGIGYK